MLVGCGAQVGPCSYDLPVATCEPGPPRTEAWVADQTTGNIEAELRDGCAFPDATIEYRIIGQRPGAGYQLLLEGELEHWGRRHAVVARPDGTTEIAVWDRSCVPQGDGFACTAIDPRFRWGE